jgi:hypothetical protein
MTARLPIRKTAALAALACTLVAGGCNDQESVGPGDLGTVTLELDHDVAGEPLVFDAVRYTNAAGNRYDVTTLRYYLSDLELVRGDGVSFALPAVHYRDGRDLRTRDWTAPGVPDGDYTAIRFTFGLDSLRNVTGSLPATTENLAMEWPPTLGGGYHYMMLDGRYELPGGGLDGWVAHFGRLQRDVDLAPMHHFFRVELRIAALAVRGDAWRVRLVMDLDQWFRSPENFDFSIYGGSVMENPNAQETLEDNGRDAFRTAEVWREAR